MSKILYVRKERIVRSREEMLEIGMRKKRHSEMQRNLKGTTIRALR
jgi:hypothetical protein